MNFLYEHLSEIGSFVGGLISGGALVTFKNSRKQASGRSRFVDQSRASAGRDNIGGDRISGRGKKG